MKYGPQRNRHQIANDNANLHAYKTWLASCESEAKMTINLHVTAMPVKHLVGQVLQRLYGNMQL